MTTRDMQIQLQELQTERALARLGELTADTGRLAELDRDVAAARAAYVGAAVTEIATLRAQLSGPQVG
jgi:hypothetical protein